MLKKKGEDVSGLEAELKEKFSKLDKVSLQSLVLWVLCMFTDVIW